MIEIAVLFFILVFISAVITKQNTSYEEFCNLECWSRRNPCCKK